MKTLVKGIREWYGSEGLSFLQIRNAIENVLIKDGFDYYYGSLVSKRSVYENYIDYLGDDFLNNLISFKINSSDLIIAPESTIRVYDYLSRHKEVSQNEGKIFYSQEFMRNEAKEEIDKGKTFTFWQIGFEIFGKKEMESSVLAMNTVENCLRSTNIPNIYFRISDKRILEGFLLNYSIKERRFIYGLIDKCNENSNRFYNQFLKNGGNKNIAKIIANLLDIKHINFSANNFLDLLKMNIRKKDITHYSSCIITYNIIINFVLV